MEYQKGFIEIILIIAIGLAVLFGGAIYSIVSQNLQPAPSPSPTPGYSPVACTMEAKQCPDGSYVGRSGPNCEFAECPKSSPVFCTQDVRQCADGSYVGRVAPTCEFAPCPAPAATGERILLKEGQREGPLLVQKMYANYITGLNYREYPVASNQGHPITLHIGESASNGCTITLTLVGIEGNTAAFIKKTDFNRPCPICLAENTLIDTPGGRLPVQDLKEGMTVWTVDTLGNRVASTIMKTSKTLVLKNHQMVRIAVDDGRELMASPGHPIGDGRIMDNLSVGDYLNGSRIIAVEKVLYNKGYTYDILPSGDTGFYFAGYNAAPGSANGIMIDSTLH